MQHMVVVPIISHLPCQFDLDATHGGRSNNFPFIHTGVSHVLKSMIKSTIMAKSFLL
jgi:hypothetical protein